MSCTESCSTDSGVENPAMVSALVAPGDAMVAGGGVAAAAAVVSAATAVSVASEAAGFLSTGTHATARTKVA